MTERRKTNWKFEKFKLVLETSVSGLFFSSVLVISIRVNFKREGTALTPENSSRCQPQAGGKGALRGVLQEKLVYKIPSSIP